MRSAGWGIPYPNNPDQIVYVWIDALINYISGIGYGTGTDWEKVWNEETQKIHVIGKNVWKFHAIYWVALLLSADLPLPNEIVIHGFLTSEGVKISKSLGNGVDPLALINYYGVDAIRFYLLHVLSFYEDSDFVENNLKNSYNSELANKYGNLVSRLLSLRGKVHEFSSEQASGIFNSNDFKVDSVEAFHLIERTNKEINDIKPWELLKDENSETLINYLKEWLGRLKTIEKLLQPIIPRGSLQLANLLEPSNQLTVSQLYPRR